MKLSWGVGITLTIIGFLIISVGTIVFSFRQDVNLVRDDYYEQEVIYQQQIDRINRTNELPEPTEIKVDGNILYIKFPSVFNNEKISGEILLFRPSNRTLDIIVPILADSNNIVEIGADKLNKGMWRVKIDWFADSTSYYNEKIIMIE